MNQEKAKSVKRWMWDRGISFGDVAMITGVSMASVSNTFNGGCEDERVIAYLRRKGCPTFADR